jgi:hypothetical protein
MRVHPLVTVKKAASLLGVDRHTIKEKLASGELRGELRRVGVKDKWFIYSGEVDFLLDKRRIPELQARADRTSIEGMSSLFDEEQPVEADNTHSTSYAGVPYFEDITSITLDEASMITEAEPTVVEGTRSGQLHMPFDQVIEIMTRQFSLRLGVEQDKLEELRRIVVNQNVLISEIPLLRAKLSEQENVNRDIRGELHELKSQLAEVRKPITTKVGDWLRKIARPITTRVNDWLLKVAGPIAS